MPVTVHAIPVLADNYAYLVDGGADPVLVDPGEADPVVRRLGSEGRRPAAILITHFHHDHIGGVAEVRAAFPEAPVFSPGPFPGSGEIRRVEEGAPFAVDGLRFEVLDLPGHATPHVAFHLPAAHILFVGDVLIGGACGRLFGHPPEILFRSLQRLASLPPETRLYFGHEYTEDNLAFAAHVDPDNPAIGERRGRVAELRRRGEPTVPSTLAEELATNPFLRCGEPRFRLLPGLGPRASDLEVFTVLRRMKDHF